MGPAFTEDHALFQFDTYLDLALNTQIYRSPFITYCAELMRKQLAG